MRALILSDVHYRDPSGVAERAVVDLVDAARADELWLLGDVFDVWWGFERVVPAAAVPLCAALWRARDRGVQVRVLGGNRDFSLGPYFWRDLGATPLPASVFRVDGRRVRVAHGDEADRSLGYRALRAGVRSAPFAAGLRLLGPDRSMAVLERLGAGSRAHGGASNATLVAAQRRWALAELRAGAELVILGHSHHRERLELPSGEIVWLGDWPHWRSGAWWEDGVLRPFAGAA